MAAKPPGMDVSLGDHVFRVQPQRQARLVRRLFSSDQGVIAAFTNLDAGSDVSTDSLYELVGGNIYAVLAVFIPDMEDKLPRWEFDGYGSEDRANADEYDEGLDKSPTVPQIKEALMIAVKVNDLDWFKHLGKVIDMDLVRGEVSLWLARLASEAQAEQTGGSPTTPSLPQANGASGQESSTPSDPTAETPGTSESPSLGFES